MCLRCVVCGYIRNCEELLCDLNSYDNHVEMSLRHRGGYTCWRFFVVHRKDKLL